MKETVLLLSCHESGNQELVCFQFSRALGITAYLNCVITRVHLLISMPDRYVVTAEVRCHEQGDNEK